MNELYKLEEKLEVKFKNQELLRQALVHRSYLNEHADFHLQHNERLEFLGDAVLELIVTEYLFKTFSNKPEGELTNWRASLVNSVMLAKIATELELEDQLYLSRGESKDKNSKARQYIMADAVEAVIGASYLDQGEEAAKKIIFKYIISKLDDIVKNELYFDPKSKFQEISQDKFGTTPHYKVLKEEGPDHAKIFEVGLFVADEQISVGSGSSKQEAQVDAARNGLKNKNW